MDQDDHVVRGVLSLGTDPSPLAQDDNHDALAPQVGSDELSEKKSPDASPFTIHVL
jgi:hypothetical protein